MHEQQQATATFFFVHVHRLSNSNKKFCARPATLLRQGGGYLYRYNHDVLVQVLQQWRNGVYQPWA